jgi:hypothetical protein
MRIDFEFDTKYGVYRDALYLPDDHTFTEVELAAMKEERLNNWIYVIENPPAPEPEIVVIDGVQYEKIQIGGQIVLKPVVV